MSTESKPVESKSEIKSTESKRTHGLINNKKFTLSVSDDGKITLTPVKEEQSKPVEAKSPEAKPAEAKPAEAKPAEAKPATTAAPASSSGGKKTKKKGKRNKKRRTIRIHR